MFRPFYVFPPVHFTNQFVDSLKEIASFYDNI